MKKITSFILAAFCAFAMVSCDKGDGSAEYGNPYIYISQAMTNGTLNNIYAVPGGDGVYTYNFKVDGDVVKVFLSAYRSGKLNATEVTVDVVANASASATNAASMGAEVMPQAMYTLPSKVTVPAGENYKTFYLELQKSALLDASAAGKTYVLCVDLANPTAYSLYEEACEVVVKLDVDAMKSHL